jgi:hypothetical protein
MAKLDYQRFVGSIDLTPRKNYRRHIDNLLDANEKLFNAAEALKEKVAVMERTNEKLLAEIERLRGLVPERGTNGRWKKKHRAS